MRGNLEQRAPAVLEAVGEGKVSIAVGDQRLRILGGTVRS
jgi:hypothetical protein